MSAVSPLLSNIRNIRLTQAFLHVIYNALSDLVLHILVKDDPSLMQRCSTIESINTVISLYYKKEAINVL